MKRQASLVKLRHWVIKRLGALRPYAIGAQNLDTQRRVQLLTFVAIDLHNTCAAFLRGYYLSSATGAWMTDGTKATAVTGFRHQREALTFAVTQVSKRKGTGPWKRIEEPSWHDVGIFLRVLNAAGCSTAPGTNSAWSIGTDALEHLTRARNFFAHRNNDTANGLRNLAADYGITAPVRPDALLVARGAGRPQLIVEDWFDDLETVFILMPA